MRAAKISRPSRIAPSASPAMSVQSPYFMEPAGMNSNSPAMAKPIRVGIGRRAAVACERGAHQPDAGERGDERHQHGSGGPSSSSDGAPTNRNGMT